MSGRFNLQDYVTVDERIDKFWEAHPDGAILTDIIWVSNDGNSVAVRATVHLDRAGPPASQGIAQEERLEGVDENGRRRGGANTTSWWENCETSAIGRALANLGMSLSKQRASREEMEKVERMAAQPSPKPTPIAPAPRKEAGGRGQGGKETAGPPSQQTAGELAGAIAEAIAAARNLAQLARIRTRLHERAEAGDLSREQADSLARSLAERQSGLAALAGRRQDAAD